MKNVVLTKEEYNTRYPQNEEDYFNSLDENNKEKYLLLQSKYSTLLTEYFIKNFSLKKYDELLENSDYSFPIVEEKNMDIYQYQASKKLKYFYIRNNIFIERLTPEEQHFLIEKFQDEVSEYDDETNSFIENTFKKVIIENYTNENVKSIGYGPDNIKFMKPNNSIIIGIRYDDYQRIPGESAEEWANENNKRLSLCEAVTDIMQIRLSKIIGVPVNVIKYNEFSVKKKGYSEEGEKVK